MRKDIDAHFRTPYGHSLDTHEVWNYWFVPRLYTYFRTSPPKIIAAPRAQQFMDALRSWSCKTLGMAGIMGPHLSL